MTTPTSPDDGKETRLVDVKGRMIVVRQLVDLQLMYLQRYAGILQKDDVDNLTKVNAIGTMLDILESAVVQPKDREYLTGLAIKGDLGLRDLMGFINVFTADKEEKPKVRRGRTPVKRT